MADKVRKVRNDVKDAAAEAVHRSKAGLEHAKRALAGDKMTSTKKVGSFLHEDLENTKADLHKAKRVVRDRT